MKAAVLITGHARSFDLCLPTWEAHIFRRLNLRPDFFVSTIADANAVKFQRLRTVYPDAQIEIEAVLEQPDTIKMLRDWGAKIPENWTPGRRYMHEPFAISSSPLAITNQFWQMEQGWNLYERTRKLRHEVIIRIRPDLFFHDLIPPTDLEHDEGALWSPGWGRFGGLNDRFAIFRSMAAAQNGMTAFSEIQRALSAGLPLHPESLFRYALAGQLVTTIHADFSTVRENGEFRPPEVTTSDLLAGSLVPGSFIA
jgi:hypothetical protein